MSNTDALAASPLRLLGWEPGADRARPGAARSKGSQRMRMVACALLIAAAGVTASPCTGTSTRLPEDQCTAWTAFFDATGGKSWTYCFDTRTDPCSCKTLTADVCNASGTTVESVRLGSNNLSGTLPQQIGAWVDLKSFAVDGNLLQGPVPASVGRWTKIRDLHLDSNHLSGVLPTMAFEQLTGCGLDSCCELLMDSGTNAFSCPWPKGAMMYCDKMTWNSHVRVTEKDCKV